MNSDLAFQGSNAFVGNFNGFQIYDISNPSDPVLRTAVVCSGGQGEVSPRTCCSCPPRKRGRALTAGRRQRRPGAHCASAREIGYYDRGPIRGTGLVLGGLWPTYYDNGAVYGSEIARGLDSWGLTATTRPLLDNYELSENEIKAAAEVQLDRLTPQHQPRFVNEPSFAVVRSFRDQLVRVDDIDAKTLGQVDKFVGRAERFCAEGKNAAAKAQLNAIANQLRGAQFADLRSGLRALADSI